MHPIHVASAAWVFASTTSKVPFYVAGAVLACWAFGLAITGLTRPSFARTARSARLVMLTSAVLVAATITTAITTAGPPAESASEAAPSNTLRLAAPASGVPAYDATSATVRAGKVPIRFANPAIVPHNVTIARGGKVIAATRTIENASTATTANLAAGDYLFYCSIDGHRQAGMRGTLTVR